MPRIPNWSNKKTYEESDLTEAVGSDDYQFNKNKMNKTDIVFYLSMVVVVWDKIAEMVKPLVSSTLFDWLAVIAVVIGTVSYTLYNKFTDTKEISN